MKEGKETPPFQSLNCRLRVIDRSNGTSGNSVILLYGSFDVKLSKDYLFHPVTVFVFRTSGSIYVRVMKIEILVELGIKT